MKHLIVCTASIIVAGCSPTPISSYSDQGLCFAWAGNNSQSLRVIEGIQTGGLSELDKDRKRELSEDLRLEIEKREIEEQCNKFKIP